MHIDLLWYRITDRETDPMWQLSRVLYAYTAPPDDAVFYIGKADFCTVRERWYRSAKPNLWDTLERECRKFRHAVLVGSAVLSNGRRLSSQLLGDVESLLIKTLAPPGNRQCITSRIARPGLRVRCGGEWPLQKRTFVDR